MGVQPIFKQRNLLRITECVAAAAVTHEHSVLSRGITPAQLLARHVTGDWGDLDDDDKRENAFSVPRYLRILSAYGRRDDPDRVWVITEADRSVTTILRPDEY